MRIEVIVEGKGAVTIDQKGSFARLDLEKLTARAHALANSSVPRKSDRIGFSAGSSLDAEVVEE
jgi:hypothetical protein